MKEGKTGFFGSVSLPYGSKKLKIGLAQPLLFREYQTMLHMNLTLLEPSTMDPLFRGWIDVQDQGSVLKPVSLSKYVGDFAVMAYPNIVNWETLSDQEVPFEIEQEYQDEQKKQANKEQEFRLESGQKTVLEFGSMSVSEGEYGTLELEVQGSHSKVKLPIRFD